MTEKKKPTTEKTFHDMGVATELADALADKGIIHPFPIQELTLPMALKGADIIGQARTGTGKTLGFGLPLLHRIDTSKNVTQALIVVPTRELCVQVADDLEIGGRKGITSIAVYGGMPIEPQTEQLTKGVHVVVGTPGRLLDHLNRGNLDLSNVTELVLDEADEMLDMGFLPDVERLIEASNSEGRHTMLFSATMPASIVSLARRYMTHPTFMRAEMEESDVAPTVDQHFFLVHRMDKPRVLARILQTPDRGGVYVFTRTKNMADRLVKELEELGVSAIAIHGDLRQTTRQKNLDTFREGKADVLVATEVAARGLDVDNVTHVVNYDCPDDDKMYLHRIGRTARAGAKGVAITFAQFNEVDRLNVIRKAVDATEHEVEEVFSTSDRLQELFDLPDETPWAHLSKKVSRAKSSGGDRKKASSDGRSKNKRSSEGRGEERSSNRDRSGSRDRKRDTSEATSRTERSKTEAKTEDKVDEKVEQKSDDTRSSRDRSRSRSEDSSSSSRTRTRTRTRSRDEDASSSKSDASSSKRDDRSSSKQDDAKADKSDSSSSDGRSRSRNSDDDATSKSSSSGRTRARARRNRGSSSSGEGQSKDDSSKSTSRSRSSRDGGSKDSGKDGSNGRSRSDDGSGSNGNGRGDRSKKSSGGGNRSRQDSGSRSGSSNRGGGASNVDVARALRGKDEQATKRGDDARGDGAPSFARRVKVEHLP